MVTRVWCTRAADLTDMSSLRVGLSRESREVNVARVSAQWSEVKLISWLRLELWKTS